MAFIVPVIIAALALGIVWWAFRTALLWFVPPGPVIAFERFMWKASKVVIVLCILGLVATCGRLAMVAVAP